MNNLIWAVVLLVLALAGIVVRKTYYSIPVKELKRRAGRHDAQAARLYRAVAYGGSLRGLLWLYIGLMTAASLIILARELPFWVSLLIVGPLLWAAFSLLPAGPTTRIGMKLTLLVTPAIAWLLNYLHPILNRGAETVEHHYVKPGHTGIFERDDLVELIERQQRQPDSRLADEELEIAKRALSFEDFKVSDIMTPAKGVKTVLTSDTIGPILIDEMHKSGQPYVLVRQAKKGPFVGTLAFRQLNLKSHGKVGAIMEETVYYLHEDDSLSQALHAFFVTNWPIFVVVNDFEEYVGILTIESVLKQLLGHVPGDDFDQYSELTMVAARHNQTEQPPEAHETPVKTDEEVVE